MTAPIVIRPSALTMYPDCGRRTAARLYPDRILEWGYTLNPTPRGIGSMVGTATHAAAGWMMEAKIETGTVGNLSEAEDRGIESFHEQRSGADVEYDTTTPSGTVAQQQIARMVKRYAADIAPVVQPTAIERMLEFKTKRGNLVRGTLDMADSGPRDLKTGTKQRQNSLQYGAYSMLLRFNGIESTQVIEDYLQRVKIKEVQPPVKSYRFDLALAENVAASVINAIEVSYEKFMESGVPFWTSANVNSVLCNKKYCPVFGTDFCPESTAKMEM